MYDHINIQIEWFAVSAFCHKSYAVIRTSKWIQKSTRRSRVWFDWLDEHKSSRTCDATILDLAVPSGHSIKTYYIRRFPTHEQQPWSCPKTTSTAFMKGSGHFGKSLLSGTSWGAIFPFHAPGKRFKAGMVDLRVGRKAGGTGAPDLAMSLLAGPLVNNLMTSTWSSAMDQWWQLLICLGFQKEYQYGGVLLEDVGRCWKKEVSCTDLTNVIWGLQSDHFHLKPKSKVLDGFVWKASAEIAELLWPPHFCKQTPPWILNLEISSESEVLLE